MRKFVLMASVATIGLLSAAGVKAADYQPPQMPVDQWTGLYIGGYIGGGAIVNEIKIPGLGAGSFNGIGGEGIIGGALIGYDYRLNSNIVIGIQGDISGSNLETSVSVPGLGSLSARPDLLYSVSGRLGWLSSEDTLLYIIAGYTHADYNVSITPGPNFNEHYDGFHVGGGIETHITPRLTARIEYRYTNFSAEDWGTGGFVKVSPSSHVGLIGLTWKLWAPEHGTYVQPVSYHEPMPASWTGFYLGGYVGGGAIVDEVRVPVIPAKFNGVGGEGFLGGAFVGYNQQVSEKLVLGVQGDIAGTNLETKLNIPSIPLSLNASPDYMVSISGRAGWLVTPQTMLYGLAGWTHTDYSVKITGPGAVIGAVGLPKTLKAHQTYDGFHVGAGIETKLTENLTARAEYRYVDFGSEDWGTGGLVKVAPSAHIGMVGLAWNFGGLR